jgi:hypothetical protein
MPAKRGNTVQEHGAGYGSHRIGDKLGRCRTQVFHHTFLANEDAYRAGDEEGWNEAEQHMLLRVPLHQVERFHDRVVKSGVPHRNVIAGEKNPGDNYQRLPFVTPIGYEPAVFQCLDQITRRTWRLLSDSLGLYDRKSLFRSHDFLSQCHNTTLNK